MKITQFDEDLLCLIPAKYKPMPSKATATALIEARTTLDNMTRQTQNQIEALRISAARNICSLRKKARAQALAHAMREAQVRQAAKLLEMDRLYTQTMKNAESDCLELASRIAEEVIGEKLQLSTNSLLQKIKSCLEQLVECHAPRIFLNPKDYASINEKRTEIFPERSALLTASEEVAIGNAIVETNAGRVEICWPVHLKQIKEMLLSRLEKSMEDK